MEKMRRELGPAPIMVGAEGFEPSTHGLKERVLCYIFRFYIIDLV